MTIGQAPSPVFFVRPRGSRRVLPPAPSRGRAGRQGSNRTHGPRRLATSRLVEVLNCRKSAKPKASRARCFLGLLRSAPGGLTVSGGPSYESPPIHRCRPKRCPAHLTVPAAVVSGARRRAAGAPGRSGLDRRAVASASPPPRHSPATAPHLMSEMVVLYSSGMEDHIERHREHPDPKDADNNGEAVVEWHWAIVSELRRYVRKRKAPFTPPPPAGAA